MSKTTRAIPAKTYEVPRDILKRVRFVEFLSAPNDYYGNPRGTAVLRDHKGGHLASVDADGYHSWSHYASSVCTAIDESMGRDHRSGVVRALSTVNTTYKETRAALRGDTFRDFPKRERVAA